MAEPNRAIIYTKPPIALHNYLRANESSTYCPPGITDVEDAARNTVNGSWRSDEDLCCGLEPVVSLLVDQIGLTKLSFIKLRNMHPTSKVTTIYIDGK